MVGEEKLSDDGNTGDSKRSVKEAPEYPKGVSLILIFVALSSGMFLTGLDQTIIGTAIPKITNEFAGLDKVSWYGSAYYMTFGGFQSSWGKSYRNFSVKYTLLVAIAFFELGSVVCAAAPNATAFIIGRAIAGLGAAGVVVGVFVIVAFAVEPHKRALFTSITGASYGIAAVTGPLLGGAFSEQVSWRWCFYINLPIGGACFLILLIFLRLKTQVVPAVSGLGGKILQMDLPGVALMMGAIVSFSLAFQYGGQTKAWNSGEVIGLLVVFVVIALVFIAWEIYQGETAMMIPRLVRQRPVWTTSLYQFAFAGCYFLLLYYLPIYFQSVGGVNPIQSGVRSLPLIIPVIIMTVSSGVFVSATGHAVPLMAAGAVLLTIGNGLLYMLDIDSPAGQWIGFQILCGFACGMAYQVPTVVVQGHVKPEDIASATAIGFCFQLLGGALGISAAQSAFANRLIATLARIAPDIDPAKVIATGAADIRAVFGPEQGPLVVTAYMAGIKIAFAITIGMAGVSAVAAMFCSWKKLYGDAAKGSGGMA
ncbi:efflux pump antibiotic resistance protein [Thozetella sp. PMI_491]|nr:efflux pump antibiotic resistance protein [Thozetella sp. PMI_491]